MVVNRTTLLIVVGCIVAGMVVSQMAHGMLLRGAAMVPPDERERIFQRQARFAAYTGLIEYLAYGALVLGIVRILGLIRDKSGVPWGFYCMAGAFVLLCLAKVVHSWLLAGAYRSEASEPRAAGAAMRSALLITVFEVALATGVCWFIATRAVARGGGSNPPAQNTNNGSNGAGSNGSGAAGDEAAKLWIGEADALEILGKDREYLHLLAQIKEVRVRQAGGQTFYRHDDVTAVKQAGLRSIEELRSIANRQNAPQPQPSKVEPQIEDATPVAPPQPVGEPLRE